MISTSRQATCWRTAIQLMRCRRGVAALEFALSGTVLLLFLSGAASLGFAVYCRGRLADAVSAATEYALVAMTESHPTTLPTASALEGVVSSVSGLALNSNLATVSTYCVNGTTPATLVAAASGATCSDGTKAGTYAVISATYTVPLLLPLGSRTTGINLSESSSVRLQ